MYGNKQELVAGAIGCTLPPTPPKKIFVHAPIIFWSAEKQCRNTFFPFLCLFFFCNSCKHNSRWHLYCFTIPGSTSIVIHSMNQCLLRNQPGSDSWDLSRLLSSCMKDYEGHSLVQTSLTALPNMTCFLVCLQVSPRR